MTSDYHAEGGPYVTYGDAQFARRCPRCGRVVKADDDVQFYEGHPVIRGPNATCQRCGRIEMPFLGFY